MLLAVVFFAAVFLVVVFFAAVFLVVVFFAAVFLVVVFFAFVVCFFWSLIAVISTKGESRVLQLELNALADVGLLGCPNAGKSTLIRSVSAAKPKVADYPFTTLHPHLGVVRIGDEKSFVVADIPGIIEGASQGIGLGTEFLKHLSRTRLLLHVVDLAENESHQVIIDNIKSVENELKSFDPDLFCKERWLVFNKLDLIPKGQAQSRIDHITGQLQWNGPVYAISAIASQGTKKLTHQVMQGLDALD